MTPPPRIRTRQAPGAPATLSNRLVIVEKYVDELRPASTRVRRAGKKQISLLQNNIERFGCLVPVLATPDGEIIDGHNIWEVCKNLDRSVPTIVVEGLTDAEVRTLRISLNRLAELSNWDDELLRNELIALLEVDPSLPFFTGFTPAEIDAIVGATPDSENETSVAPSGLPLNGRDGDIWDVPGEHVLMQGNARHQAAYTQLVGETRMKAVVCDMPYGCEIFGHASSTHANFADGSGLSKAELEDLVRSYLTNAATVTCEGALFYTFMDASGLLPLMSVAERLDHRQLALCVWDKVNPGMGSFYRQQAEFVLVSKVGNTSHLNNVSLGKNGRNRSTIWPYPGLAGFGAARSKTLAMHPTIKPIGLISELLMDCTRRGDCVLDPFAGSGTILLAAQRTKRKAFAMELDPKYIDVAIKRIEGETGKKAKHRETGAEYAQVMIERAATATREAPAARLRHRAERESGSSQ